MTQNYRSIVICVDKPQRPLSGESISIHFTTDASQCFASRRYCGPPSASSVVHYLQSKPAGLAITARQTHDSLQPGSLLSGPSSPTIFVQGVPNITTHIFALTTAVANTNKTTVLTSFLRIRGKPNLHHRWFASSHYINHAPRLRPSRNSFLQPIFNFLQHTTTTDSDFKSLSFRNLRYNPSLASQKNALRFYYSQGPLVSCLERFAFAHVLIVKRTWRHLKKEDSKGQPVLSNKNRDTNGRTD